MALNGEYEPSPREWVRDQVEAYEYQTNTDRRIPVFVAERK
jgi:hypothetical protein